MLELALQLRPAIARFATLDQRYKFNPSDEECEAMIAIVGHLKVFYEATLKLSGTKYPTMNLFFAEFCEVYLCIKKMEDSSHSFIRLMGKDMFSKWEKYWTSGNTLLAIACVLDPRAKLAVVEYYFDMIYPSDCDTFVTNLKVCMNALFTEYLEAHSLQNQAGSSSVLGSANNTIASSVVSNTRAGLKDFMKGKKSTEPVKTEIESYLTDPLDETSLDDDFDILAWWKINAPKYPILARLCRDILAVPISTVASEGTFSTSGRILSSIRNCLNNESMEALICAQDWLRASITESGGEIGEPLWSSEEVAIDGLNV